MVSSNHRRIGDSSLSDRMAMIEILDSLAWNDSLVSVLEFPRPLASLKTDIKSILYSETFHTFGSHNESHRVISEDKVDLLSLTVVLNKKDAFTRITKAYPEWILVPNEHDRNVLFYLCILARVDFLEYLLIHSPPEITKKALYSFDKNLKTPVEYVLELRLDNVFSMLNSYGQLDNNAWFQDGKDLETKVIEAGLLTQRISSVIKDRNLPVLIEKDAGMFCMTMLKNESLSFLFTRNYMGTRAIDKASNESLPADLISRIMSEEKSSLMKPDPTEEEVKLFKRAVSEKNYRQIKNHLKNFDFLGEHRSVLMDAYYKAFESCNVRLFVSLLVTPCIFSWTPSSYLRLLAGKVPKHLHEYVKTLNVTLPLPSILALIGNEEMFKALIQLVPESLSVLDSDRSSPFHYAVLARRKDLILSISKSDIVHPQFINYINSKGTSPFEYMVISQQEDLIVKLIRNGIYPLDQEVVRGLFPVHIIASHADKKTFRTFIRHFGIDEFSRLTTRLENVMHLMLLHNKYADTEMIKIVFHGKPQLFHGINAQGKTPLIQAQSSGGGALVDFVQGLVTPTVDTLQDYVESTMVTRKKRKKRSKRNIRSYFSDLDSTSYLSDSISIYSDLDTLFDESEYIATIYNRNDDDNIVDVVDLLLSSEWKDQAFQMKYMETLESRKFLQALIQRVVASGDRKKMIRITHTLLKSHHSILIPEAFEQFVKTMKPTLYRSEESVNFLKINRKIMKRERLIFEWIIYLWTALEKDFPNPMSDYFIRDVILPILWNREFQSESPVMGLQFTENFLYVVRWTVENMFARRVYQVTIMDQIEQLASNKFYQTILNERFKELKDLIAGLMEKHRKDVENCRKGDNIDCKDGPFENEECKQMSPNELKSILPMTEDMIRESQARKQEHLGYYDTAKPHPQHFNSWHYYGYTPSEWARFVYELEHNQMIRDIQLQQEEQQDNNKDDSELDSDSDDDSLIIII